MSIPEETIARIAGANDIVQVVGKYVSLTPQGEAYRAVCPFHHGEGFAVDPRKQLYKCFGCGAGGTVFRFIMDFERLSFADALRRLAERADIPCGLPN